MRAEAYICRRCNKETYSFNHKCEVEDDLWDARARKNKRKEQVKKENGKKNIQNIKRRIRKTHN